MRISLLWRIAPLSTIVRGTKVERYWNKVGTIVFFLIAPEKSTENTRSLQTKTMNVYLKRGGAGISVPFLVEKTPISFSLFYPLLPSFLSFVIHILTRQNFVGDDLVLKDDSQGLFAGLHYPFPGSAKVRAGRRRETSANVLNSQPFSNFSCVHSCYPFT